MVKAILLFLFIITSSNLLSNNDYIPDIQSYTILPPDTYVFNYRNEKQNDCGDVNSATEWVGDKITPNDRKELCRHLYYYIEPSKVRRRDEHMYKCGKDDEICNYYKALYEKEKGELKALYKALYRKEKIALKAFYAKDEERLEKLKELDVTYDALIENINPRILACQWTGDVCTSIASSALSSRYPFFSSAVAKVSTVGDTKYINEDSFVRTPEDAKDINIKFMHQLKYGDPIIVRSLRNPAVVGNRIIDVNVDECYLLDFIGMRKKEEAGTGKLLKLSIDDFNDHSRSFKYRKKDCNVNKVEYIHNYILDQLNVEDLYEDPKDPYRIKISNEKLSNLLVSELLKKKKIMKPKYAVEVRPVPYENFIDFHIIKDGIEKANEDIIAMISNAPRGIDGKLDGAYFYVVEIKEIDWVTGNVPEHKLVARFIYHDDMFSFIPLNYARKRNKYKISNEIPKRKYGERFCKDMKKRFELDPNIQIAGTLWGTKPSVLPKGNLRKFPNSLKKLTYLQKFCSKTSNFIKQYNDETKVEREHIKDLRKSLEKKIQDVKDEPSEANLTDLAEFLDGDGDGDFKALFEKRKLWSISNSISKGTKLLPTPYEEELKEIIGTTTPGSAQYFMNIATNMGHVDVYYYDKENTYGWILNRKYVKKLFKEEEEESDPEVYFDIFRRLYADETKQEGKVKDFMERKWTQVLSQLNAVIAVLAGVQSKNVIVSSYIQTGAVSPDVTGAGDEDPEKEGKFWKWLGKGITGETLLKAGLGVWAIKAAMKEMDRDMQQIAAELELKKKLAEMQANPCYALKDRTEKFTVINPITHKSEERTLYEICLVNHIMGGQKGLYDQCFQMMNAPPGMFSQWDIRNCFRSLAGIAPGELRGRPSYPSLTAKKTPKKSPITPKDKKDKKDPLKGGVAAGTPSAAGAPTGLVPPKRVERREGAKSPFYRSGRYTATTPFQRTHYRDIGRKKEEPRLAPKPEPMEEYLMSSFKIMLYNVHRKAIKERTGY